MTTLHRPVDTSQFSSADFQKIVDYIAILISIDRKNALQNKGEAS
jgi:hypothetical protein